MPAGLGGAGYLAWTREVTMGTYLPPTTAGTIFIPIVDESLTYNEDRYLSRQIRQQVIVTEVKQSYYSVGGDVTFEVDPAFLPHLMYMTRHFISKTGTAPSIEYEFTPAPFGSAVGGAGNNACTASITIVRNNVGFGYAGCVLGGYEFTIEDGVLRCTANVLGLSEQTPAGLGTPVWTPANLYGAADNAIFVGASGVSPTFGAPSVDFNGFTFSADFNAEAQNRIRTDRSASYISFGETEATYDTELDFINKAEYTNMLDTTTRAVQLLATHGDTTYALADDAVEITLNRTVYETYEVALGAMGDLIMAGVTGRVVGQAGGDAYTIRVKTAADVV